MHHELDPLFFQDRAHRRLIAKADFVEGNGWRDRAPVPINKVVNHHGPVPGSGQLPHAVAPDVTSPASNEYIHQARLVLIFPV
jgi:hypothetical protein